MTRPDSEIFLEVRKIVLAHRTRQTTSRVMKTLDAIMQDPHDNAEFVRLMQKWLASV